MRSTSAGAIGIATYSARMRALTVIPKKPGTAEVREVPDPVPADDEVVIDVIRVGLCGTDAEIDRGEYGIAPSGSGFLILGHESVGRVTRRARAAGKGMGLVESTLVVASVRRPDGCPNCSRGEADMCLWGDYTERGIRGLHGFCAERYAERPEYLFPVPEEIAAVAVLLEPLSISEKGWRQVSAAQRRMTIWEPRRASVTGGGRSLEVPADDINKLLVLSNALVLGTVNGNAVDFRQGLVDLAAAERRWPGFLLSLITRRVPLEKATEALRHDPAQIKQVVEIRP